MRPLRSAQRAERAPHESEVATWAIEAQVEHDARLGASEEHLEPVVARDADLLDVVRERVGVARVCECSP